MRRNLILSFSLLLASLAVTSARAQDILVPAGTLLRCTMSEPNFSSATAQVGDPVLCHLSSVQEFGRNAFPRGAYMSGHLEADKEPGHFVGKGFLKIVFDRIGTPNSDIAVDTKMVAAQGFKVNKEGDIRGKGHARRDVVEWLIPPLWPWKVLMLPARGPRPTLKGEERLTMRLMEDVTIPRPGAAYNSRDWRPPVAENRPSSYSYQPRVSQAPAFVVTNSRNVVSVDPGFKQASQIEVAKTAETNVQQAIAQTEAPQVTQNSLPRPPTSALTLIALRNEAIWAVSSYWLDGDRLDYILPSGTRESCDLNSVDLMRTTQLNAERGVSVTFQVAQPAQLSLPAAQN
jgi:hypothetical protein